mgnify:CR=1 FL=1
MTDIWKRLDDRQLLAAYQERRASTAFDAFVRRHERDTIAFASKLLGDADAARDVAQDVFIKIARMPKHFEKRATGSNFRGLVLKMAHDRCVDTLRRRAAEKRALEKKASADAATGNASVSPDDALLNAERSARLHAAISELPDRTREILLLKSFDGWSYGKIAGSLGITPSNVGFILHQAMKELGDRLGKE